MNTASKPRGGGRRLWRRLAEARLRWRDPTLTTLTVLLAAQMFVIHPLDVVAHSPLLALPLLAPLLLIAVIVVSDSLIAATIALGGVVMTAAATVLHFRGASSPALLLHFAAALVVACTLFWVAAGAVFAPGRITYHRIIGTFLLYLIIGAMFSGVFGVVAVLAPHAFRGMAGPDKPGALVDQALYFSFSTLTTAGFGDITPGDALTRGLSNLEAVAGQLFPPTVIAWMMTLRLAEHTRGAPRAEARTAGGYAASLGRKRGSSAGRLGNGDRGEREHDD